MLRFLKAALVLEIFAVAWLSVLMGLFFYRAYSTSSTEHLPLSFLAALVILVLGIQQTAMSFRRERLRSALVFPPDPRSRIYSHLANTTFIALLLLAVSVIAVILRHHLR